MNACAITVRGVKREEERGKDKEEKDRTALIL